MLLFTNHDKIQKFFKRYDFFASYIDDGQQYKNAIAQNDKIYKALNAIGCKIDFESRKLDTRDLQSAFESIFYKEECYGGYIVWELVEDNYSYSIKEYIERTEHTERTERD